MTQDQIILFAWLGSFLGRIPRIVERWKVRDEDARELLGGLSSSAYYEWKKNTDRVLEVDRITRVSYLRGQRPISESSTATPPHSRPGPATNPT